MKNAFFIEKNVFNNNPDGIQSHYQNKEFHHLLIKMNTARSDFKLPYLNTTGTEYTQQNVVEICSGHQRKDHEKCHKHEGSLQPKKRFVYLKTSKKKKQIYRQIAHKKTGSGDPSRF